MYADAPFARACRDKLIKAHAALNLDMPLSDILGAFEERAAIMEYDGGFTRSKAELRAVKEVYQEMQP